MQASLSPISLLHKRAQAGEGRWKEHSASGCEPPAFGAASAVERPARGELVAMRDIGAAGIDPVAEEGHDDGALVMQDALHLAIFLGALLLVELGARLEEELVEAVILEMRVVPVGARGI